MLTEFNMVPPELSLHSGLLRGLSALEAYVWNCSEPFHEISLADNEITVEVLTMADVALKMGTWLIHIGFGSFS